jgi:hypothetical protein
MKNKPLLIGQATAEQIKEWKEQYGQVFKYEVDGKVCYLRTVDRNVYTLAVSKISTSPAKFSEIILSNIWLGGDEELKTNDQYYFGLIDFIEELMAKKKGSLTAL